jgi:transposase
MEAYPKAAMERAMKVQDVMLQAMAKKITWWQAAEILGISDRHMRRWRERYVEEGYNGLFDRRRGKPSRRRVPVATVEKVFALYREKYFDLNVQHFHEKLQAEHGIELSYTWVKQALQGAGLVGRGRKRGAHRKRRERRPLPGMLLHIDGSRHQWFQDERWYDLIVILDDASEIYYAQLVGRGIDGDGNGGAAGSHRAPGRVLRAVQRSRQPFLADSEGGCQGGLSPPDPGGAGVARVGCADDSGLLAASTGPQRAQLLDLAGAIAAGVKTAPSPVWKPPMYFCGSTTWPSSTGDFKWQRHSGEARFCPAEGGI